ncbi:MAG: 50S ribosomal protein L4 [Vampirovibrionales bacterium]|nr:50S ribosomal protein L4 [Vampirovibrionales bacterium]
MSETALNVYSPSGEVTGSVQASDDVFGIEPHKHALYLALRRELANARSGSAKTKTRAEVRGGGRKPWKQKGTGRARAGSIRSPLWRGGGVIFGPQPRDFSIQLPKKVRRLALRSSLSAARAKFRVLKDFSFLTAPKTRQMADLLKNLSLSDQRVLILADYRLEQNAHLKLAARNLPRVILRLPADLSVKDLLHADAVLADESAIQAINQRYAAHV